MKCPMRAPPTKSRSAINSVSSMATERSGSSAASTSSTPITATNGISPFAETAQVLSLLYDQHRDPHDHSELGEFGRLERRAEEKSLRPVDRGCDASRQDEHGGHRHDGEPHDRPRPPAKLLRVELGGDEEHQNPRREPFDLANEEEHARAVVGDRDERARAVQHGEAESAEYRAHEHHEPRLRAHAPSVSNVGARGGRPPTVALGVEARIRLRRGWPRLEKQLVHRLSAVATPQSRAV